MSFYGNLDASEPAFKATGRVKRGAWREPETRMWHSGYFSQAPVPGPAWNSLFNTLGVSVTDSRRRPVRDGATGFDLLSGRLDTGLCNKASLGLSSHAVRSQEKPTPLTRMTSLECSESEL